MGKDDDFISESYAYQWSPKSDGTLQDFLAKYKPSMVQNDGTKPWLWVAKAEQSQDVMQKGAQIATEEATEYLAGVTERVQKIQNDDSIPVRSNKKKGLKSKKELREEVQHEATGKLKEISVKHSYLVGKWLIFASPDKVDMIWSSIANSLVSGPLFSTSAYLAKVATSPQADTPNYSHLICVYMPDVYDQAGVTEVMRVLLRNHGINLMGVKTDLYTSIGLDSKHPSGVSSTVWKNTALMKDTEIKQLKDEYFAELNSAKTAAAEETAAKKASSGASTKAKPKLKKKAGVDDPFASDEEGGKERDGDKKAEKPAAPSKATAKKPAPKKRTLADDFADDDDAGDDDADEEARKVEVKAKKKAAPMKRKSEESDEDSDDAPKKKRGRA